MICVIGIVTFIHLEELTYEPDTDASSLDYLLITTTKQKIEVPIDQYAVQVDATGHPYLTGYLRSPSPNPKWFTCAWASAEMKKLSSISSPE